MLALLLQLFFPCFLRRLSNSSLETSPLDPLDLVIWNNFLLIISLEKISMNDLILKFFRYIVKLEPFTSFLSGQESEYIIIWLIWQNIWYKNMRLLSFEPGRICPKKNYYFFPPVLSPSWKIVSLKCSMGVFVHVEFIFCSFKVIRFTWTGKAAKKPVKPRGWPRGSPRSIYFWIHLEGFHSTNSNMPLSSLFRLSFRSYHAK